VRELAAEPGGDHYAHVLRELFGLDVVPAAETVADVPTDVYPRDADLYSGDADLYPPGIDNAGGERG
jgi:hypothetical protein